MEKRVIPVLEMSCAVCAATVEKTVRELTGVEEASVNFSANTLQVVYDPDKISLKDMQAAVSAAGYDLVISDNAEADAIDAEHRLYLDLRRRTIGAWSFGLPVMVLSMIFHSPSQILSVQLVQYDLSAFLAFFGNCSACLLRSGCYDYSFCFVGEIIGSEG